jgi:DNA-binding NarL/FixJ family response regulator
MRGEIERLAHRNGGSKILIVEDSTLFRQLLKEMLHDRFPGIEITEAVDGEEAFRQIEISRPDLIFMDIRLPGENGLDLTKKIKSRFPGIIVVILTGHDLPEYQELSWQCADYFFSKNSSTAQNIFTLVESVLPTPA